MRPSDIQGKEEEHFIDERTMRSLARLVTRGALEVEKRTCEGSSEADTNRYRVVTHGHHVATPGRDVASDGHHGGGDARSLQVVTPSRGGGDRVTHKVPSEVPKGSPQETSFALTGVPTRAKRVAKASKHTPDEIAAKDRIVAAFVEGVKARKGVEPKLAHAGDHAAAFALARAYWDEAPGIVLRALDDDFVLTKNCTLRGIAAKADTYRATVPTKHKNGYQAVPEGGPIWLAAGGEGKPS